MGIACLETSQACSWSGWPQVSAPQLPVETPRAWPGRIDTPALRHLNPDQHSGQRAMHKDWALVQQAIAGNADAQERLFAAHTRSLYRTVFALLQNKEDAEDALQDGLCKAYTSLRSFEGRSSFSTWLTRIVINSALMARRKKSAHPEASLDEILESQPEKLPHGAIDAQPDPEEFYAANEISALVDEHLRQLPPTLQAPFRIHAINGLSGPESSKAIGISPSAFKSRICRARKKLACGLKRSLETGAIAIALGKRGQMYSGY